jgi:YVTN family beta-propeller protein
VDDGPGGPAVTTEGSQIHTFLIADVRGWTLFTQTHGDEAAAKLAARFAEIAREVIEARDGHVLELRGDEAMCVFSSARQAIRAAVEFQDRLYEETVSNPELPLPVGIGLDAGEAVAVEGGYRGGALNLAARLCGQAKAGEILASRGVTHLAQRVDGVRFVDRGKVHLKNLTEPVEMILVVPEGVDPAARLRAALPPTGPPRRRSRARIAITAAVALALVVAAAVVLLPDDAEPRIGAGSVGFLDPSGALAGTVDVGEAPRGLAQGAGSLWVTDHQSRSLVQVDAATFQVRERIPVGAGPTGVAVAAGLVWVANTDDRTVSVVDPQAQRVVQTVVVGNGPAAIASDGGRVWVANSVDATVTEIDANDGAVTGIYPVGERPVAIAVGAGAIWVVNASDDNVSRVVPGEGETGTIPVGRGPAAIAFAFGSLWVANAEDGTVTTIDPDTASATTERVGVSADALASAGDDLWVASARDGAIFRIDPATTQVTDAYEVGDEPRALAGTEDGLWVGVEPSPAVHRGGTLRLVTEGAVQIDPHVGDVISSYLLASSYDGLVTYRRTGGAAGSTVVPDLAVSLPVPTDGGRTYTFTLRDGIRFSNGDAVTSRDVVASIERILTGRKYGRLLLPELVGASSCASRDPEACDLSRAVVADEGAGTVTFHLARRAPDLLRILATPGFAIVPAGTPIRLEGEPIPATGPYMIGDVAQGGSLVLERNPMFREWSADAQPDAFADRVQIEAGVDLAQQVAMVERGEADLGLGGVPVGLIYELERRASDQLVRSQFPGMIALALNTATYPFDRADARRALANALDRDALNRAWIETAETLPREAVFGEETSTSCQILPPSTPGYTPYCPYTRSGAEVTGSWVGPDLSRARQLVERSGTFGAEVVIAMSPCVEPTAQQVSATLRDLGYQVVMRDDGPLRPSGAECWFGALSSEADVSYAAWVADYPSPASFLVPLLSCVQPDGSPSVEGAGDFSLNSANFCDPEIDRRMQRALDLQLIDSHASARAFEAVEHDLVDLAPLVPYGTATDVWIVSKRVSNLEFNPQFLGVIVSQVWVR